MTHPSDALGLVQELRAAANGMFNLKNERGDYGYFDSLADRIESLAAASASPLPEGGGDWINGLLDVPVGSPTWCAWATHEIMNLRSQLPAAPIGDAK